MIAADNLASDKQHGDTASAGHSPYNAPMTLQRGDHLESAHKSALAGSGRDRSVSKSRNVSFMYDGEDPDGAGGRQR